MQWTLPNILTVFRLAAAPAVALVYLILPRPFADMAALTLFVLAALTDYVDGYLARRWDQVSRFGAMLDPIADKAMVVIALTLLLALTGAGALILVPVVVILFREVFVSGLREFLGDTAGTLAVTGLAKWKTAAQMVAIAVLFLRGIAEHYFGMLSYGMGPDLPAEVLSGGVVDTVGLRFWYGAALVTGWGGLALLWLAAVLTAITGVDYYLKARPHLQESPR